MRNNIYLFAIIFLGFAACKKDGSSSADCNVVTVSLLPAGGTPSVVNFTYGDE